MKYVIKQRIDHMPKHLRSSVESTSTDILSFMQSSSNCAEFNDDDDGKYDKEYEYPAWNVPRINISRYYGDDEKNGSAVNAVYDKKIDKEETYLINECETDVSTKSVNFSIAISDDFGVSLDAIIGIFDLLSVKSDHMEKIKELMKVTVYEEGQFPVQIGMYFFFLVFYEFCFFRNSDVFGIGSS